MIEHIKNDRNIEINMMACLLPKIQSIQNILNRQTVTCYLYIQEHINRLKHSFSKFYDVTQHKL